MKPTISRCYAKLYVKDPAERVIAEAFCSAESDDPIAVWVPTVNLAKIEVGWEADAVSPAPLPSAIYIDNSPVPIGVTKANYAVQFPAKSKSLIFACALCECSTVILMTSYCYCKPLLTVVFVNHWLLMTYLIFHYGLYHSSNLIGNKYWYLVKKF